MQILHIAGYQFIELTDLLSLKEKLRQQCLALQLKGTILLSPEGANINLAGAAHDIEQCIDFIHAHTPFKALSFRKSVSQVLPYQRLKVKIKKEIITFRQSHIAPTERQAPHISPHQLKTWLDEKKELTLLDVRNDYEIEHGTFVGAAHLQIDHFCHFATAIAPISRERPIVMFCTGGIRCEKAGLYMLEQGFSEVYQLEGGILNYFSLVGNAHYQGDCFVFDERVALNSADMTKDTLQCTICNNTVSQKENL